MNIMMTTMTILMISTLMNIIMMIKIIHNKRIEIIDLSLPNPKVNFYKIKEIKNMKMKMKNRINIIKLVLKKKKISIIKKMKIFKNLII